MTRDEARADLLLTQSDIFYRPKDDSIDMAIKALEQEPCEDYMSRADALRVAENEYSRGWHNALCKALSEKYSIHCEDGNFSVIQEETISGLGLSMDCAVGKDVENYMSTIPRVTPQEPILDKIRAEIKAIDINGRVDKHTMFIRSAEQVKQMALEVIDKYNEESEEEG